MTEVKNIHQRVLAIMGDIDYIQKGQTRVANQYRFVSHDAVISKLHPLFVKHGITVIPTIEAMTQEGNRTRVDIAVYFTNVDTPTDQFVVKYSGYGVDSSDKGPGKAISYALKYALLKTFALETGEDPDIDQETSYEPDKCPEFDEALPDISKEERKQVDNFLEHLANINHKHVEELKKHALGNMSGFIKAFNAWNKE